MAKLIRELIEKSNHLGSLDGNSQIANAVFDIPSRKPVFEFYSLKAYVIRPLIISVPLRYDGFDVLISGEFDRDKNRKTEILLCYNKVSGRTFHRIKMWLLSNSQRSECEFVTRYFERFFLRKRCRFRILHTITNPNGTYGYGI